MENLIYWLDKLIHLSRLLLIILTGVFLLSIYNGRPCVVTSITLQCRRLVYKFRNIISRHSKTEQVGNRIDLSPRKEAYTIVMLITTTLLETYFGEILLTKLSIWSVLILLRNQRKRQLFCPSFSSHRITLV